MGRLLYLSPQQQCQSTEVDSMHWSQSVNIVHCTSVFVDLQTDSSLNRHSSPFTVTLQVHQQILSWQQWLQQRCKTDYINWTTLDTCLHISTQHSSRLVRLLITSVSRTHKCDCVYCMSKLTNESCEQVRDQVADKKSPTRLRTCYI